MLGSVLASLIAQSSAFAPVGGVQVSCLENLRGKVGRARVEIVVGAGALDEGENERGIAHLLEHLLLRPINFDDSNATTSWDFTSFYRDVTGGELQEASIELLRAIRVAGFDDQSFETEKKIVLNELRDRGVSMSAGVDPIFGDTMLARLPGGDDASVRTLRTADAKSYHQRFYTKGNVAVVLRGAVECASLSKALAPELKKFAEGIAAATTHVREPEPGPRALPHVPGEFLQGFYWYNASPEDEVVWRVIVRHLEHRALDELRKERAITYSPQGSFSRRGYGGQIDLTVKTQDGESDAAEWYQAELASLRADPHPKQTMIGSIQRVRKALESDSARAGLAAIRNEPQPIEILDKLDDVDLQARLQRLLEERRSFGTATPESNVASLIVLGLFGVLVLVVLWVAVRKLVS